MSLKISQMVDSASISDKIVVISNGTYYSSEPGVTTILGNTAYMADSASISDKILLITQQEAIMPSILGEDLLVSPVISGSGTNFMINQDAIFEFEFYDENDALLVELAELEYTASVLTGETLISSVEIAPVDTNSTTVEIAPVDTNSTTVEIAPVDTNSTTVEIAPVDTNSTTVEIAPVDTNSTNPISNFVGMLFGLKLVQFADAKKMSSDEKIDYDLATAKSKISDIKSKIADQKEFKIR
ncbi:hypothetical protein C5F47_00345 [Nitrosopumilus cobalaminigenes]|uniref:Uncharacterized protein n=1 Tax=Nitrosopumilus cobalaminigenes TaxID=1470066 RepID=A0A7D5R4X0_9ARCH|nr:hypothetical protein C5F47_00345 [Nitrosopumilus cobalaminigenes]